MQRLIEPGAHLDDLLARFRASRPPDEDSPVAAPADPACVRCRDVGFLRRDVPVDHPDFGRPVDCPCGVAGKRRRARAWAAAGIPPLFAAASFGTYAVSRWSAPVLDTMRTTWMAEPWSWLFLHGLSGRGKTWLAVSALRELAERSDDVRFMAAPDLFDWIRESFDETLGVREGERLGELRTVRVLAIDDLGREQLTPWVQMRLWALLNARLGSQLRTIVTTNLDELALAGRIGESAYARIEQGCGPDGRFVLKLDGPDLRAGGGAR